LKKILFFFTLIQLIVISGCSSFIADEDVEKLKVYESDNGTYQEYVLLEEIVRNGMVLAKGEIVRILIVTDDEWIKVYAYRASEGLLKSVRFLVLHMFDDDFPDSKFDREKFDLELGKIIAKAGSSDNKKRAETKKKRSKSR
jgi:type II secretion system-associated lipoprotein